MKAVLLLLLCGPLGASSIEPWLGGTRPYETVPQMELNPQFWAAGPDFLGGIRLDFGLLDHLMLRGAWTRDDLLADAHVFDGGLQARLAEEGELFADLGAFAGYRAVNLDSGAAKQGAYGGLILAWEPWDHSLSFNAEYSTADGMQGRLGWRSPYLFWSLRLGFDWAFGDRLSQMWPQLSFLLPGDIAIQAGLVRGQLSSAYTGRAEDSQAWAPALSLSYNLFPSP